jgi:hypothetical protein
MPSKELSRTQFRTRAHDGERIYILEIRQSGREFLIEGILPDGDVITRWHLKTIAPRDLSEAQRCAWETAESQARFSGEEIINPPKGTAPTWSS